MRLMPILIGGIFLLSAVFFVAGTSAQREPVPPWREPMPAARTTAEITVGEVPVTVELAISPEEHALGLGYRNDLAPGREMLFVFEEPAERRFWMQGMRFCLDIIWIGNSEIVGAAEDACPDPEGTDDADRKSYPSGEPVTHVLEMPAGWLADNGFSPGTQVVIPESLR